MTVRVEQLLTYLAPQKLSCPLNDRMTNSEATCFIFLRLEVIFIPKQCSCNAWVNSAVLPAILKKDPFTFFHFVDVL